MKNLCNLFSLGLILIFSSEIIAQTPMQAENALMQKYPTAEDVEWEKEDDGFEAEFEIDGQEKEALFDKKGNWIETEWDMDEDDLPEAVKSSLGREFPSYEIEDAEGLESKEFGKDLYKVELESDNSEIEVVINNAGKILKKKVLKEVDIEDLVDEIEDVVD